MENNITPTLYQPKPIFELTKNDTVFSIFACVLSVCVSVFGLFGGFSLGYLASAILFFLLFAIYFKKSAKITFFGLLCGILSVGLTLVFITTTNPSVRFFTVIVGFLLSLIFFDSLINGASKGNRKTIGIFYSAFSSADNIAISLKSLFSNKNGNKRNVGKALVGLVCAIPVLIVIIPLLISSDDAFSGMMTNIFKNTSSSIIKAVFGLVISIFVISYGFSTKTQRVAILQKSKFKGIENVYLISFLSAIGVCYLLYLFSQLAYFFSAFRGFLPEGGITYSQYARKGFFEMCAIAVINLVIVFLSLIISKKKKRKVCLGIKILSTFISVFTLVIIATAISKMVLYINAYGMTVLRLTTSSFMVFLSVVFISLILRIYSAKINLIKTAVITAGCIILLLGTVNVNAVCAKYNYESYVNGRLQTIDINALYELGDEGIPYVIKLTQHNDPITSRDAEEYLAQAYLYDYFEGVQENTSISLEELKQHSNYKGFSHFSIPKHKAYQELYKFIEQNPDFIFIRSILFEDMEYRY